MKFVQEIRDLIEHQFTLARRAKSDEECMECVKILREENSNLLEQARLLRTKAAKLYAKVEFIRENNKIVGYVISAVSVVLAGAEIAAGFTLIGTMTPLGVLAGAILVTDGTNSIRKKWLATQLTTLPVKGWSRMPRCLQLSLWALVVRMG